jgi:hypothetical protein
VAQEKKENCMNDLRDKLLHLVANLTGEGLEKVNMFVDLMDGMEIYNSNTTPERLAELKQQKCKEAEAFNMERKKEKLEIVARREEVLVKNSRLFKRLDKVKSSELMIGVCEITAIAEKNGNAIFDSAMDYIKLGFLMGQKVRKTKIKGGISNE